MPKQADDISEIKILHLSDLHYDSSKPRDTEIVLNALWRDLESFRDIDLIMFSGDLVKAGDKKVDFEKAYQAFIKPLLDKTGLDETNFYIVPGNHDIQRDSIDEIIEGGLKSGLIDRESLNAFLDIQLEKGFTHIERLTHFNDFKTRFTLNGTITSNKLFSTHKFEKENLNIGIACLNSCWRATGKGSGHDRGKLLIGERQIDTALNDLDGCNIKIALFHHSLDWLIEFDQGDAKKRLSREFDFVFCGHLHDPSLELVQSFNNNSVLIQGGCLYHGRSFYNGYSVMCFDHQKSEGVIYLQSYFDDRRAFDKAINKCKGGKILIKKPSTFTEEPSLYQKLDEIVNMGMANFLIQKYEIAFECFEKAKELKPSNRKVQLYYCLSYLAGKPLLSIDRYQMNQINNILNEIVQGQDLELANLARIILGIIRYDYYIKNGYKYHGLPTQEIIRFLGNYKPSREEIQLVNHITCSEPARIMFNLD